MTAHPAASEAAAAMLRAGGNAADAAVVAAYVLTVVEQFSAGVGGGGFLLYRDGKTKRTFALDYREVAPKKARRDMYLVDGKADPKLSRHGIKSVGVPGAVAGLDVFQKRFGNKKLGESLDAAIALAQNGVSVTKDFHATAEFRLGLLRGNAAAAKAFLKDGELYAIGESLKQPDLAKTLRQLKVEGAKLFSHGAVAKAIVAESDRLGGLLTIDDLKRYRPRWRAPVRGHYRGFEVVSMPPPSSGGIHLIQMLRLLELDREERGRTTNWQDADDVHVLIESMRRAYADRAEHLGDPAFHRVPTEHLLDDGYLKSRYASIDVAKASKADEVSDLRQRQLRESNDTTHMVIIDRDGNCVSLTQTVNLGFGSGVVVPGTGILLNDEMDDFSAQPGVANAFGLVGDEANSVQPGKIPLSSMTPTIVLKDGDVRMLVGSPGGSRIITSVLQSILHYFDHEMDLLAAVGTPRIHQQWLPDLVMIEKGAMSAELLEDLRARGHEITEREHTWSNVTAIVQDASGKRVGVADPRVDGAAAAE